VWGMEADIKSAIKTTAEAGRPIIGCFPLYPPVELIHSMGFHPMILWGFRDLFKTTSQSDRHVQSFTCSVARHLVEFVFSDFGQSLAGVFAYNACDTLRNLPEIIGRGLADRRGIKEGGFFIETMHLPMGGVVGDAGDYLEGYLAREINRVISACERSLGAEFSNAAFQKSVLLYNTLRRLMSDLEEKVNQGVLPFMEFSRLVSMANLLPVEAAIETLSSTVAQMRGKNPRGYSEDCRRIIVSGILPPPPRIGDLFEAADIIVAGNDIASLARSYASPTMDEGEDVKPGEYYYKRFYKDHSPCTTLHHTAGRRIETILALCRERRACGFVFFGEKFCEHEYFEYPYLEKRLKEAGISSLFLEFSIDDGENVEQFKTRIQAFAELLSSR